MNIQLAILIGYILLLGVVSWFAVKIQNRGGGGSMLNYLMAGKSLPTSLVAVMLTGLAIGGASTVGVAENAYTAGISAGWYNGAWGTGGILVGLFAARYFRKMNVNTVPEMMGIMFGPSSRLLGVIIQLLVMISITSLQYVAGGAILTALLPDIFTFQQGMIASAVIFIGITVVGGYWASGLTNIINVIVIYIGIIAALIGATTSLGGFSAIKATLPAGGHWFERVSGMGTAIVTAWMVVMVTQCFSTQAIAQISFAAKDEKTARNGFLIGGILILPAGFLCSLFGIMAAAKFPGLPNAALALPTIVSQLSPLVGGIFLAGLWAADVSTAVGLLMGCSTLVIQDVWKQLYTKPVSARSELLISRAIVLGVSLLSFLLALSVVGILKTLTTALAITTSFSLLIMANIYVPHLCKKASGFWILLASLLLWIMWTYVPSLRIGPHLIYLEWVVCFAIFTICAIICKEPAGRLLPDNGNK